MQVWAVTTYVFNWSLIVWLVVANAVVVLAYFCLRRLRTERSRGLVASGLGWVFGFLLVADITVVSALVVEGIAYAFGVPLSPPGP